MGNGNQGANGQEQFSAQSVHDQERATHANANRKFGSDFQGTLVFGVSRIEMTDGIHVMLLMIVAQFREWQRLTISCASLSHLPRQY